MQSFNKFSLQLFWWNHLKCVVFLKKVLSHIHGPQAASFNHQAYRYIKLLYLSNITYRDQSFWWRILHFSFLNIKNFTIFTCDWFTEFEKTARNSLPFARKSFQVNQYSTWNLSDLKAMVLGDSRVGYMPLICPLVRTSGVVTWNGFWHISHETHRLHKTIFPKTDNISKGCVSPQAFINGNPFL